MAQTTTRNDLADIVKSYFQKGATAGFDVTDAAKLNPAINRGLADFTAFTYCNRDWSQTLTVSGGIFSYDTSPMFHVENVTVNGNMLMRSRTETGPMSRNMFFTSFPNWAAAASGIPSVWVRDVQSQILLHPKPDATVITVELAGYVYHTAIDVTSGGDTVIISIDDAYIDLVALWIATKILFPGAAGANAFSRLRSLDQMAGEKLKEFKAKNMGESSGPITLFKPNRRISM